LDSERPGATDDGKLPKQFAGPEMTDPIPDRIAVTFSLIADDYARYYAILSRRQSNWTNIFACVAALFSAIPVALTFRALGTRLSDYPEAADLIGEFSLAAFLLGTIAIVVAGFFPRKIAIRKHLTGTPNAFESKTAVIDAAGISLIGQISQATWRWAAISSFTSDRGLLLIWIGQSSAVVIPRRGFASDGAYDTAKALIRARLADARRA
jgi:hypothetical protein